MRQAARLPFCFPHLMTFQTPKCMIQSFPVDNTAPSKYNKYDLYNFSHLEVSCMNQLPPLPGKYAWTVKVGEKGQFVIPK